MAFYELTCRCDLPSAEYGLRDEKQLLVMSVSSLNVRAVFWREFFPPFGDEQRSTALFRHSSIHTLLDEYIEYFFARESSLQKKRDSKSPEN